MDKKIFQICFIYNIKPMDIFYKTRTGECVYFQAIFFTKNLQLIKNTFILKHILVNWAVVSSILILLVAFRLCLIIQKVHFHIYKWLML